jgi:ABC-type antimicrobial peptide transport system ATPase subunit
LSCLQGRPSDAKRIKVILDDPKTTEYKDRDNINILDEDEVAKKSKELGVSPEQLKDTVNRVGVLKEDVRQQIKNP